MHFYRPLRELRALTFDLDDTIYDNQPVIARGEYESVQFLQQYHPALHCLGHDHYQRLRRKLRQRELEIYHDVSYWRWRRCRHGGGPALAQPDRCTGGRPTARWRPSAPACRWWRYPTIMSPTMPADWRAISATFCAPAPDGRAKLWQDMYVLMAARLNVPPGNILHVGNDLEADVTGAIRYGIQAC